MGVIKDDLTGQRFGRLDVLEYVGSDGRGHTKWRCKCDCGNEKVVLGSNLKRGATISCGCYQKERSTIHGFHNDPLYQIWKGMHRRCNDERFINYHNYGGRGIRVCDEWYDFESFRDWSIYNGYEPGLTLDRIDVNGDYEPNNCRWADWETQANNRRSNVRFTYKGITHTISEWSKILDINPKKLSYRIYHDNMYDFATYYGDDLNYENPPRHIEK